MLFTTNVIFDLLTGHRLSGRQFKLDRRRRILGEAEAVIGISFQYRRGKSS